MHLQMFALRIETASFFEERKKDIVKSLTLRSLSEVEKRPKNKKIRLTQKSM